MSEEQSVQETETPAPEEKQTGTDFVEFDDPKVEARFKRMYAHVKEGERKVGSLESALKASAAEQRKLIERLEARERKEAQKETKGEIDNLRKAEKQAMEEGNYEQATLVRDKITELTIESKKEPPKKEESKVDPGAANYINDWAAATDESGNLLRPWADPGHEDHQVALTLARGVFAQMEGQPIDQVLAELDKQAKRLAPRKPKADDAAVLSSGDGRPKPAKTKLTSDQKAIAGAMYPDLSPAEAAKRYAAAMEKYS